MRRMHLIPNPRYNRYDSTHIRCCDGIYNIVFNWSADQLVKFDNFLNRHAFNTAHEQIVYAAVTSPYIVERYNDMVERVNAMNRSCREMRGDESKIDEYQALKKTRAKLVKTLLSTFKKVEQKSEANNISYKLIHQSTL